MSVTRDLWRVKDIAEKLSCSQVFVRQLVEEGILHKRYIGKSQRFYRITNESYEAYLDSLVEEPVA